MSRTPTRPRAPSICPLPFSHNAAPPSSGAEEGGCSGAGSLEDGEAGRVGFSWRTPGTSPQSRKSYSHLVVNSEGVSSCISTTHYRTTGGLKLNESHSFLIEKRGAKRLKTTRLERGPSSFACHTCAGETSSIAAACRGV